MRAYVSQAALLCEDCALARKAVIRTTKPDNVDDEDSDYWPQGPHSDGGGEADSPQHCDACRTFLENPLTPDGYKYVQAWVDSGNGDTAIIAEWSEFYDVKQTDKELI